MRRLILLLVPIVLSAQIRWSNTTTTATSAVIHYNAGTSAVCSLQVADVNRQIAVTNATVYAAGTVTISTASPHGLASNSVVYIEGTSAWNIWETITIATASWQASTSYSLGNLLIDPAGFAQEVTTAGTSASGSAPSFSGTLGVTTTNGSVTWTNVGQSVSVFTIPATGVTSSNSGNVGVLVNDVNAALGGAFTNANLDNRPGQLLGSNRSFQVGVPMQAPLDSISNRDTRALQAGSRHHATLTCPANTGFAYDFPDFTTQITQEGSTHNDGVPVDPATPGTYSLPTQQWAIGAAASIDPVKGIKSERASAPNDAVISGQAFVTPFASTGWSNPGGPITSGTATFTGGACTPAPQCGLFLRADGFIVNAGPGGLPASYTNDTGNSLDSIVVTVTGASSTVTATINACLVVDGKACGTPTKTFNLTTSSATYTFGSGALMDLWQSGSQPPITAVDVTQGSGGAGSVTYNSSTKVLTLNTCGIAQTYCGSPFSLKWTAGSLITVGSTVCTIASVQSEAKVTMSSCSISSGSYSFTANNFGVLIWTTNASGTASIGPTTFQSATAPMAVFGTFGTSPTGPLVTYRGVQGYFYFAANELYWFDAVGGAHYDLGVATVPPGGVSPAGFACGSSQSDSGYTWDSAAVPGAWVCLLQYFSSPGTSSMHINNWQYTGNNHVNRPSAQIFDCNSHPGLDPCIQFTDLSGDVTVTGANPSAQSHNSICNSRFSTASIWSNGGLGSPYLAFLSTTNQNSFGCIYVYTLGTNVPRTAIGTSGGVAFVGASPTFYNYPFCWCSVHDLFPPTPDGWVGFGSGEGDQLDSTYQTSMKTALTISPGSVCPATIPSFGQPLTGNHCDTVSLSTLTPLNPSSGTIRAIAPGDVFGVGGADPNENFLILQTTGGGSPTAIVWRGYNGSNIQAFPSTPYTFTMLCGVSNQYSHLNAAFPSQGLWNAVADPLGTNTSGTTVIQDPLNLGGHQNAIVSLPAQPVLFGAAGAAFAPGLCPTGNYCGQIRPGTGYTNSIRTTTLTTQGSVSMCPTFAGVRGLGCPSPDNVDTHAGPAFGPFIMDARPFTGDDGVRTVATPGSPFTQSGSTQCWSIPFSTYGGTNPLHRKFLTTLAYVGRFGLSDVSGPGVILGCTSSDSYKYCYADIAGECHAGSSVGDIWINSPFVSIPYCYQNFVATQGDDINSICVSDLGAFSGQFLQDGWTTNDMTGFTFRQLGPGCNIWNQQDVFWNVNSTPDGRIVGNLGRWCNGIRSEVMLAYPTPYLGPDSIARNTFVPISQVFNPPPWVNGVTVKYWYQESGTGCTSDSDQCVANASTINLSNPFFLARETYTPESCSGSCMVTMATLSGKTLSWYYEYWNGSNKVFTSPLQTPVSVP